MNKNSVYDILENFRNAEKRLKNSINEENKWNADYKNGAESVPYTNQDELLTTSIDTAKQQFGANFSNIKTPMLYYPSDGDIVLSGEINSLSGAKFQFRYKDPSSEGCFLWIEPMQLTDNNLTILKKILGVFKNWKRQIDSIDDNRPIGMKNNENEDNIPNVNS